MTSIPFVKFLKKSKFSSRRPELRTLHGKAVVHWVQKLTEASSDDTQDPLVLSKVISMQFSTFKVKKKKSDFFFIFSISNKSDTKKKNYRFFHHLVVNKFRISVLLIGALMYDFSL